MGFISRYQLELSDGVTESFLQLQWPLYAPLNALTAFCLTLILFALCGRWCLSTGLSGAVFTIIALINYYTRDLHGSALMPQDIFESGHRRRGHGQLHPLKITQDVVKIALLYLPILGIAFVQHLLAKGAPQTRRLARTHRARSGQCAGCVSGHVLRLLRAGEHQAQDDLRLGMAEHLLHLRLSGRHDRGHQPDGRPHH